MDEMDIMDMEVIDILDNSDDDEIEIIDNIDGGDEEKNNKQLNVQKCLSSLKSSHLYKLYQSCPNRVPTPDLKVTAWGLCHWHKIIQAYVCSKEFMLTKKDCEILLEEMKRLVC